MVRSRTNALWFLFASTVLCSYTVNTWERGTIQLQLTRLNTSPRLLLRLSWASDLHFWTWRQYGCSQCPVTKPNRQGGMKITIFRLLFAHLLPHTTTTSIVFMRQSELGDLHMDRSCSVADMNPSFHWTLKSNLHAILVEIQPHKVISKLVLVLPSLDILHHILVNLHSSVSKNI